MSYTIFILSCRSINSEKRDAANVFINNAIQQTLSSLFGKFNILKEERRISKYRFDNLNKDLVFIKKSLKIQNEYFNTAYEQVIELFSNDLSADHFYSKKQINIFMDYYKEKKNRTKIIKRTNYYKFYNRFISLLQST